MKGACGNYRVEDADLLSSIGIEALRDTGICLFMDL